MRMIKLLPALVPFAMSFLVSAGCAHSKCPTTQPAKDQIGAAAAADPKAAGDPADEDAEAAEKTKGPRRTLYERLGGEAAIVALVDDLVARAMADASVNFTRSGTPHPWQATPENLSRLKQRLVQFLGTATGGPQQYEGEDMRTAHRGLQITRAEFEAFVGHLRAALERAGVTEKERKEVLEMMRGAWGTVVEKRSGSPGTRPAAQAR